MAVLSLLEWFQSGVDYIARVLVGFKCDAERHGGRYLQRADPGMHPFEETTRGLCDQSSARL